MNACGIMYLCVHEEEKNNFNFKVQNSILRSVQTK